MNGGSANQKYNLRWHDYPQSVVTSFRHLKEDEDFVDVTLACNSQQFTAHKVVLSACSPYFKKLLKVRSSNTKFYFSAANKMMLLLLISAGKSPKLWLFPLTKWNFDNFCNGMFRFGFKSVPWGGKLCTSKKLPDVQAWNNSDNSKIKFIQFDFKHHADCGYISFASI